MSTSIPVSEISLQERLQEASGHAARVKELEDALLAMVNLYTRIVNSGDGGFWNSEEEVEVIAAREALGESKCGN